MILTFREFLTRDGHEERVLAGLRKWSTTMIRDRKAEAVVVCQRVDAPQHLLWIQHHAGPSGGAVDEQGSVSSIESGWVESGGGPVRVKFVDGAYQFPLPPCRIWKAETSDEQAARTVLKIARLAVADARVVGVSVYRTLEVPSRMIAFFAFGQDVRPCDHVDFAGTGHEARLTFFPLRVDWTAGRLTPGTSAVSLLVRYPRAAFWARPGLVSPLQAAAVAPE